MTISTTTWLAQLRNIITPHYLRKRINLKFAIGIIKKIYLESKNPNFPWLTYDSVKILENLIKSNDKVLEFGSGQSTRWFVTKTKNIISLEHDPKWYQSTQQITQAKVILGQTKPKYLAILSKIKNNSIDICLVDGQWRRDCLLGVFKKIKTGGMIILDNAETILPIWWSSNSFQDSWQYLGHPEKNKTNKIVHELKTWRLISTTDVTQDTVIFIKNK